MSEVEMEYSHQHGQDMAVAGAVPESNLVDGMVAEKLSYKEPDGLSPNRSGAENKNVPQDYHNGVVNSMDNSAVIVTAEGDAGTEPDTVFATPNALVKCSNRNSADGSEDTSKNWVVESMTEEEENGTLEEQLAFMKELEDFYRGKSLEFKPPRFYGHPLNCLKLWRSVTRLGGYDRVTGSKLWRQVGEAFNPPKTCTTVSWTFRIFYEKSLLEYERHKSNSGHLQLAVVPVPEPPSVENEPPASGHTAGSGRARRDAAARAMQGWHIQRLLGNFEVTEPIIKERNSNSGPKREKSLKSIGSKNKRSAEVEYAVKAARTNTAKQLVTTVVDIGPPADWVKINVRESKDCFEIYALVPGLLRDEVRVQSDPAGRVVITGIPEQAQNPWGITAFKKVVHLPGRIDPLQTSAVVSLHGRLFVRVPFEQLNG